MNHKLFKYIKDNFPQCPNSIDKLIVSAYLACNEIQQVNNKLISSYVIKKSDASAVQQLQEFINVLNTYYSKVDFEVLIQLFEYVISPSDKIITGAVYTPNFIRNQIISSVFTKVQVVGEKWRSCDLSCGCGGFLVTMSRKIKEKTRFSYQEIFKNNIFGLDIKDYAVERSKILLSLLAITEGEDNDSFLFNLYVGDALNFEWANHVYNFNGFDCIVGNPPYVCSRQIDVATKPHLNKFTVCKTGHPDLYIPFFQLGVELLKENGILGFITMNSFFKSLNGRALRQFFHQCSYSFRIDDFGTIQVFDKKSTYTCICLICKSKSEYIEYRKIRSLPELQYIGEYNYISYEELNPHSGWNFVCIDIIKQIESTGTPLHQLFKTKTGIATLKNEVYIFTPNSSDECYYYKNDNKLWPIEKGICKEVINANKLTENKNITELTEQVIFPYKYVNGKAVIFDENEFINNFPFAYAYLLSQKDFLNTRDKGNKQYKYWYAFGRTQCLEQYKYKLLYPHIASSIPHFLLNENPNLYFYNGIAAVSESIDELLILQKILASRLFWFYIVNTSKPYSSGFLSLSRNYIKDFGLVKLNVDEKKFILEQSDQSIIDDFLENKYEVYLPESFSASKLFCLKSK